MCTRYPIINRVSELKVHIELTRFVQPEKIEIDANERAVNEKSQYCFFVCTTFDSLLNDLRLYIWQGDITTLKCDAIVNACNSQMLGCFSPMHACIDNFIHTYAGMELRLKMHEIMAKQGHEEETGKAKITSGYNLPTKYILHTVGPIIQWKVTKEDEDLLAGCYTECLKLAADTGVESIAFCCLSTGVFHFPQQRAAEIATNTVKQYLNKDSRIKKVIFNVFKDEDLKIYSGLL